MLLLTLHSTTLDHSSIRPRQVVLILLLGLRAVLSFLLLLLDLFAFLLLALFLFLLLLGLLCLQVPIG